MKLLLEIPLNRLSFGNVSYNLVRELHKLNIEIGIFPIGNIDLSAFDVSDELKAYIEQAIDQRWEFLKQDIPCLKLWHLNGSENRKNKDQFLFTFYECNEPTDPEVALCTHQDLTFFSFSYLNVFFNYQEVENAKKIYESILDDEIPNGMPLDVIEKGKRSFEERLKKIDWKTGPVRRCIRCDDALNPKHHRNLNGYCGHCTTFMEQNNG